MNAGRDEGAVALAAAVSLAAAKRDLRTPRERGAMRGLCTRRKESNDLPIFAQRWRNANSHHAGVCLPAVSELPLRAPRFVNRQTGHSPVSWFKFRISGSCKGWRKEKGEKKHDGVIDGIPVVARNSAGLRLRQPCHAAIRDILQMFRFMAAT